MRFVGNNDDISAVGEERGLSAFLLRHEFLDGGENHAAAPDIERFAQMFDRLRLHRSLPQNFVATLELPEES